MNITLDKQYTTKSGLTVKLYDIVTDTNQTYPVIGAYYFYDEDDKVYSWIADSWSLEGANSNLPNRHLVDLIEVPKHNFIIGEPILVWDNDDTTKYIRFFHSQKSDGVYVYDDGEVPSESTRVVVFDNCEPYYPIRESKPLEVGEAVIVWDDLYENDLDCFSIRKFHSKNETIGRFITYNCYSDESGGYTQWVNCIRLSEFTL